MDKKILQVAFDKMEGIGWTLDNFKETYSVHKEYLGVVLEKFENGEIEENELVWCAQFLYDFLDCLEGLDSDKEKDGSKLYM